MDLHQVAAEVGLDDAAALALCARIGIPASWPGAFLTGDEAARLRSAASGPPQAPPGTALPPPVGQPFAPPAGQPFAAGPPAGQPFAAGPPAGQPVGGYAQGVGWASPTGAPGPAAMGGPIPGGPPPGVTAADWSRLGQAKARARSHVLSGLGLIALALVITVGTIIVAPGGFFVVSFGTFFVGVRRLSAGMKLQSKVRQAEAQLRRG